MICGSPINSVADYNHLDISQVGEGVINMQHEWCKWHRQPMCVWLTADLRGNRHYSGIQGREQKSEQKIR